MPRSEVNNRTFPLEANGTFTGLAESTATGVAISVSVLVPTACTLTIQQSYDKVTWFINEQYPITANAHKTVQQAVGLEYFRVILHNDGITQTFCHLISTLSTSLTQNVNIRNLEAARDTVDISGNIGVNNFPAVQVISGTVAVSSQPALSYLTDNVAVATMPAITGTVAVSSQPYLSYLTDNVAVATMPAITGTVAVSSQPPLSYLTDNIAVATQPALTFATDKVDATGSAVTISTALPAGANRIGEVITREDPASASNLTSINTISQQIKATPGSLMNFTAFNDGNAISYVKIYNSLTATSADTPIVTFPIRHDSALNTINTHNLQFSTGICVRATAGYAANDNTAPNGSTSIVAFYNGLL